MQPAGTVNQAQLSYRLSRASCVLGLHSTTQVVVSRLHATVLGKRCVVQIRIQVTELRFPLR